MILFSHALIKDVRAYQLDMTPKLEPRLNLQERPSADFFLLSGPVQALLMSLLSSFVERWSIFRVLKVFDAFLFGLFSGFGPKSGFGPPSLWC